MDFVRSLLHSLVHTLVQRPIEWVLQFEWMNLVIPITQGVTIMGVSRLAPTQALLNEAFSPWITSMTLTDPSALAPEMLEMILYLRSHPAVFYQEILPMLCLAGLSSVIVIVVGQKIGQWLGNRVIQRLQGDISPEATTPAVS